MDMTWNEITYEELKRLYYYERLTDREIANRYSVGIGKVTYKRRKFGITFKSMVYENFMDSNRPLFNELNMKSKERLFRRDNIDSISKAVTQFAFRNGPVEDMHANNQLSQSDMKVLNKYMVNRIAGLLTAIADNNWLQLELLLAYYRKFGDEWDGVEPDMKEINLALQYAIEDVLK